MTASSIRHLPLLAITLLAACATQRPAPDAPPTGPSPRPAPAVEVSPSVVAPTPVEAVPAAPTPEPSAPLRDDHPRTLGRVSFAAVGDMLPHVSVKLSAKRHERSGAGGVSENNDGWDPLFAGMTPDLAGVDFPYVNLETPVSPGGDPGNKEFHFNAPPVLLAALKTAGFRFVGFANNHVYDQGHRGLVETLDELVKAQLPQAGSGRTRQEALAGIRLEKDGVRVAVLGASQFFNNSGAAPSGENEPMALLLEDGKALAEAVAAARSDSDFVIVSIHWGVEYQPAPRQTEIDLAHALLEAGADVILGTHPHVLQPLEVYRAADGRTCLIAYSLGNFLSNQSRQYSHGVSPENVGDTRDGALLRFAVEKRDYGNGVVRSELADVSYVPLWTDNDYLTRVGKALPDIRVVSIPRALADARRELDALRAALGEQKPTKEQEAELVRLRKRVELLERRQQIIEKRLGADFASPAPPNA